MPSSGSFHIISSLRYDPLLPEALNQNDQQSTYPDPQNNPQYYLLPYHRDRLISAAKRFQWPTALAFLEQRDLADLAHQLDFSIPDKTKPWRLRILLDRDGDLKVEVNPAVPVPALYLLAPSPSVLRRRAGMDSSVWRVYVDMQPISPSAFTTHKTTFRDDYNAARLRVGILSPAELAEVLVMNAHGEVMEGSITTPYFRRRSRIHSCEAADSAEWITPPLSSGGNAGTTRRLALTQGFCNEQVVHTSVLVDGEECWLSNGVRGFMPGVILKHCPDNKSDNNEKHH